MEMTSGKKVLTNANQHREKGETEAAFNRRDDVGGEHHEDDDQPQVRQNRTRGRHGEDAEVADYPICMELSVDFFNYYEGQGLIHQKLNTGLD